MKGRRGIVEGCFERDVMCTGRFFLGFCSKWRGSGGGGSLDTLEAVFVLFLCLCGCVIRRYMLLNCLKKKKSVMYKLCV